MLKKRDRITDGDYRMIGCIFYGRQTLKVLAYKIITGKVKIILFHLSILDENQTKSLVKIFS
jgi:hypothetical protein